MRRPGSRNSGYEERRRALLNVLTERLSDRSGGWPTMRELAAAADCSVSTLRHYFGRRDEVVVAVFNHVAEGTGAQLEATRAAGGDFALSVEQAARLTTEALYDPAIVRLVSMGLIESLSSQDIGPSFLDTMLDPFVIAMADRFQTHIERGEMRPVDTRMAAMALISPILIAALHQKRLGGEACRPLDREAQVRQIAGMFIAAYGADGGGTDDAAPPHGRR